MRFDEKLILAKLESTYAEDSTPAGVNAVLGKDVEITPIEAEALERGIIKPYLGADEKLVFGEHVLLSFKVEAQGSGSLGVAPGCGSLLRAAGFAEIIVDATSVEYSLAPSTLESATFYYYQGTTLHAMNGARAAVKFSMEKGIPYLEFNVIGLYVDPATVAVPTPDFSVWQKPTLTGKGRTSNFALMGYAAEPYKLMLDVGQTVKYSQTLVSEKIELNDRDAKGSVTIENPLLAQHDYFADVKNSTKGALTITHGNVGGLILKVDCPNVQLSAPKYSDQEKTTGLDLELTLIPTTAGNDEIKFTFT